MIVKIALLCLLLGCVLSNTSENTQSKIFLSQKIDSQKSITDIVEMPGVAQAYLLLSGKGSATISLYDTSSRKQQKITCHAKESNSLCLLWSSLSEEAPNSPKKLVLTSFGDVSSSDMKPFEVKLFGGNYANLESSNILDIQTNGVSHLQATIDLADKEKLNKFNNPKMFVSIKSTGLASKVNLPHDEHLVGKLAHLVQEKRVSQISTKGLPKNGIELELNAADKRGCDTSSCYYTLSVQLPKYKHLKLSTRLSSFDSEPTFKEEHIASFKKNSHLSSTDVLTFWSASDETTGVKSTKEATLAKSEFDKLSDNLLLGKMIGRGAFGTVYKCFDHIHKLDLVAKQINKRLLIKKGSGPEEVQSELRALRKLPVHKNVCRFYRVFETVTDVWIVMEHCGVTTVYDKVMNYGTNEGELKKYMKQVLEGQSALHKAGVYQVDVKLTNMMITAQNEIKLIDFGLAYTTNDPISFRMGADGYYTYEMTLGKEYHPEQVDSWGDGICIYKALYGLAPFGTRFDATFRRKVAKLEWNFPSDKPAPSEELRDLLLKVFQPEDKRLTVEQMLEHPWIKGA